MKYTKKRNPNLTMHSNSNISFRVLVKNRTNKQSEELYTQNLSTGFQKQQINADVTSVRSRSSHYSTHAIQPQHEKIKKYVRAMKEKTQPIQTKNQKCQSRHSQRSCRSKISNRQSIYSKKDFDCKSTISKKDFSMNNSIHESPINIILASQQPKDKLQKLVKLQEKVDSLIRTKINASILRQKSRNRFQVQPFMGASSGIIIPEENQLESQLKMILEFIKHLKQRQQQEGDKSFIQQDIFQLTKKIQILEKIIASSSTQSQIVKKYYFAGKSQKYPHLNTKSKIIGEMSKRQSLLKSNNLASSDSFSKPKSSLGKYISTSNGTYLKPSKQAYEKEKIKYSSFIANRQPLPRSNYNCQFLNYGNLPIFKYKPHDTKLSTSCLGTKTTNYQQNFKDKTAINNMHLDYKQMDCFKDKFRNTNISFMQTCRKKDWTMEKKKKKVQNKSTQNLKENTKQCQNEHDKLKKALETVHKLKETNAPSLILGRTETNSTFIWHKKQSQVQQDPNRNTYGKTSLTKNGNLQRLKNMYKSTAMRA